ncbi:MAG: hypothetical protein ABIR18_00820, partial [Chitinophagaceae bacterium]
IAIPGVDLFLNARASYDIPASPAFTSGKPHIRVSFFDTGNENLLTRYGGFIDLLRPADQSQKQSVTGFGRKRYNKMLKYLILQSNWLTRQNIKSFCVEKKDINKMNYNS